MISLEHFVRSKDVVYLPVDRLLAFFGVERKKEIVLNH